MHFRVAATFTFSVTARITQLKHRISVGALTLKDKRLLLARHYDQGKYDFWAPPGGGVEGEEELSDAVEREVFEETQIRVKAKRIAYIDELIDKLCKSQLNI